MRVIQYGLKKSSHYASIVRSDRSCKYSLSTVSLRSAMVHYDGMVILVRHTLIIIHYAVLNSIYYTIHYNTCMYMYMYD